MKFRILSAFAAVALLAACGVEDDGSSADGSGSSTLQQAFVTASGNDHVYFALDRYDLDADARATLERQADWLKSNSGVRVTIEGHADERGTREYNLALGERRANSVQRYLSANGVDNSRIQTVSYGKERPEVLGSGEAVWAKNRRGVTLVAN